MLAGRASLALARDGSGAPRDPDFRRGRRFRGVPRSQALGRLRSAASVWDRCTVVGAWEFGPAELHQGELAFALRNPEMPLEAMRFDLTPADLHYVLVHFDIPFIDVSSWRLEVGGHVKRELALTLEELRERPSVSAPVTLECAGNGRALLSPRSEGGMPWLYGGCSTSEWTGPPLRAVLEEAGVLEGAVEVLFSGADEGIEEDLVQYYQRSLPLEEALRPEVMLAYQMNGQPMPARHGFPLRLVVPGWYGMASVKWLRRITVLTEPFTEYMQTSYSYQQTEEDPGTPVTRIAPRSLMIRPGIANDLGVRLMRSRDFELRGRAWSGWAPVERVEVSLDGGASWADAKLEPGRSPYAWIGWRFEATLPGEGEYELRSRATDAAGNVQPDGPPWNLWGYSNNAVERVRVKVVAG